MSNASYSIVIAGALATGAPGNPLIIDKGSFHMDDTLGQRAPADFTLTDLAGAYHFAQGEPVSVFDTTGLLVWAGFVQSSTEQRIVYPSGLRHTVRCMDMVWLADKRTVAKGYVSMLAGDIVADLVTNYLAAEGVIGTRTAPVFTRATIAYRGSDGVQVSSGAPRYEPGIITSSSAIRIDDACNNTLSANQSSVETNTVGFNAQGSTLTQDNTRAWNGTNCLKVVTNNLAAGEGVNVPIPVSVLTAGAPGAISVYIQGTGTVQLLAQQQSPLVTLATGATVTLTGSWQRITLTGFTLPNPLVGSNYLLSIYTPTQQAATIYVDGLQWEQTNYYTSWQIGGTSRNREVLALPAVGGMSAAAGTIQFRVLIDANVQRQTAGHGQHLFGADRVPDGGADGTGFKLFHSDSSATWVLGLARAATITTFVSFPDMSNGWHKVAVAWDLASMIVYVDGVAQVTVSNPTLPAGWKGTLNIGCDGGGFNQANTLFQDVRLYARKRTATELTADAALSTFLTNDDTTAYLCNLNGSLATGPSSIEDGPTVNEATVNYAPGSTALAKLAEVSNKWWNIDLNHLLHFRDRATLSAPQAISGTLMEVDDQVTVEYSAPLYRNRQFITGGTDLTSSQTETRKGDGNSRAFTFSYPFAKVPTVTVNAVSKTVGIKGVDTGKDWYWAKGDPVLAQDTGAAVLISTDTLSVTYQGQFPLVYVAEDTSQVAANQAAEGFVTSGYVDAIDVVTGTTSSTSSAQYAAGKLLRYAQGGVIVTFTTRTAGFKSGQLADVSIAAHGLSHASMLIESVSARDVALDIWYTVKCVAGPVNSTWLDFFTQLAARSTFIDILNIGANGPLVLAQTVNETWTWSESVTQTVFACPLPATTLFPSTTLFPC